MPDIGTEGRELVITHDGRVRRAPVPDGFSPAMFRHVVAGVDLLYRKNGRLPTVDEVMKSWEGFDRATVRKAFASPELPAALRLRGIEWDEKQGLSAEQMYAITILQNPDGRSTKAKLEEVGISMGKYRAWMRNPIFSSAMNSQAEQNLGDAVQMALNKLVANAEAGDNRAIEKILEISGRWNPQQQEIQNAKSIVLMFMEALQKHADRDTLKKVMDEVSSKSQALTIVQSLKEIA